MDLDITEDQQTITIDKPVVDAVAKKTMEKSCTTTTEAVAETVTEEV